MSDGEEEQHISLALFALIVPFACMLMGFSTAVSAQTSWYLVVPLLFVGFEMDILHAVFVSMMCDLCNGISLSLINGCHGYIDWKFGSLFGVITACFAVPPALLLRHIIENELEIVKYTAALIPAVMAVVFFIKGIQILRNKKNQNKNENKKKRGGNKKKNKKGMIIEGEGEQEQHQQQQQQQHAPEGISDLLRNSGEFEEQQVDEGEEQAEEEEEDLGNNYLGEEQGLVKKGEKGEKERSLSNEYDEDEEEEEEKKGGKKQGVNNKRLEPDEMNGHHDSLTFPVVKLDRNGKSNSFFGDLEMKSFVRTSSLSKIVKDVRVNPEEQAQELVKIKKQLCASDLNLLRSRPVFRYKKLTLSAKQILAISIICHAGLGIFMGILYVGGGIFFAFISATLWNAPLKPAICTGVFSKTIVLFCVALTFAKEDDFFAGDTNEHLLLSVPFGIFGALIGAKLADRVSDGWLKIVISVSSGLVAAAVLTNAFTT